MGAGHLMSTLFPVLGWVFTDTRNLFASDLILNFTNFIMSLYVKVEKTSYIAFKQQMWHSLHDYVCLCVYMLLLVHHVLVQSVAGFHTGFSVWGGENFQ